MKELQRRQKIKRALYSLPALFILLGLSVLLVKGAVGMVEKQRESARILRELRHEAQAMTLRSQELEDSIARLDTEEGVVEEIKEKFNVSLEGEHVAILVDEVPKEGAAQKPAAPWYERLWNAIIGR